MQNFCYSTNAMINTLQTCVTLETITTFCSKRRVQCHFLQHASQWFQKVNFLKNCALMKSFLYTSDQNKDMWETHIVYYQPSCNCCTDAPTILSSKQLQCCYSALYNTVCIHLSKDKRERYLKDGIFQPFTKSLGLTLLILRKIISMHSLSIVFDAM